MNRSVVVLSLSLLLLASGCSSTGVFRLEGSKGVPPNRETCPIEVYASEADVKKPFVKLCVIDAKTGSTLYSDRSAEGALRIVKKAACSCGADAVILEGVEKKGVSWTSWGASRAKVVAIKYQP